MAPQPCNNVTGLNDVLKDVVAYVEVRTETEDISCTIANEMKVIGAKISKNRNSTVTHVIFRNGTLRTSEWAKKHKLDLIDIGWLAACFRYKDNLLSRPWHVPYLKENLDQYGLKKRMKYKKYYKNMSVEEFEANLERSSERRRKKIEQLNNSKSDLSCNNDSPINQQIPKRRQKTPEAIKRFKDRIDLRKQTGRYVWELDDENVEVKGNSDVENQEESQNQSVVKDINKSDEKSPPKTQISEEPIRRQKVKGRRLFNQLNGSQGSLIEPIHKSDSSVDLSSILPKCVQKGIEGVVRKSLKRSSWVLEKEDKSYKPSSPMAISDICLPNKKRCVKPNKTPDLTNSSSPLPSFSTPVKSSLARPLSPLITEQSTKTSPGDKFFTPKNRKRLSLRTRLLKQSAKKKYRQSLMDGNSDSSDCMATPNNDPSTILVPQTAFADRQKSTVLMDNVETVMETPFSPDNSPRMNNNLGDSVTSSVMGNIIDTPNMSRFLDNVIPNRKKPDSYDHILFMAKEPYDHSSKSLSPNFTEHRKYIADSLLTQERLADVKSWQAPNLTLDTSRKNCRVTRSSFSKLNRLSGEKPSDHGLMDVSVVLERISSTVSSPMSIFNQHSSGSDPSVTKSSTDSPTGVSNIFRQDDSSAPNSQNLDSPLTMLRAPSPRRPVSGRSIKLIKRDPPVKSTSESTNLTQTTDEPINRKRPFSKIANQKAESKKATTKTKSPPPPPKNSKRFRDSSDSFITDFQSISKRKPIRTPSKIELVMVGFPNEEKNCMKMLCNRLPDAYQMVSMIRCKEQIIILPDNPKKSIELVKAFVFGNTFVSSKWIDKSVKAKAWLDYLPFVIKETDLIDTQIVPPVHNLLFSDYCPMYISASSKGIQKYKLRVIIEMAGGKVTDSFRQAGVVINTRKVNALSVKDSWILDSIKEGQVLNPKKYSIL